MRARVPALVSLQYFGWNHLLRDYARRRLAQEGLLQDVKVASLQVVELDALLLLGENGARAGTDMPTLLAGRARDPWFSGLPLKNYLVAQGAALSWRTPHLRRQMSAIYDLIRGVLRSPGAADRMEPD